MINYVTDDDHQSLMIIDLIIESLLPSLLDYHVMMINIMIGLMMTALPTTNHDVIIDYYYY